MSGGRAILGPFGHGGDGGAQCSDRGRSGGRQAILRPLRSRMPRPSHLLVISGLSGAGKSQASKLFEDLGYSCVDNLPPALLDDFLALRRAEPDRFRRSALVLDIRAGDPAPAIERASADARVAKGRSWRSSSSRQATPASSAASARHATGIRCRRRAAGSRPASPRSGDVWRGHATSQTMSSTPAGSRSGSSRTGCSPSSRASRIPTSFGSTS